VPLIGGWDWDSSETSKFRLLAFAGFSANSAVLLYTSGRQALYTLDAGVSAVHLLNPKHQITWSLGAGFAEDSSTVSSPKIKMPGDVVAAYRPRTIWSLSNAFSSAFKELESIPQFKVTAKLGEFLETRFSKSF